MEWIITHVYRTNLPDASFLHAFIVFTAEWLNNVLSGEQVIRKWRQPHISGSE